MKQMTTRIWKTLSAMLLVFSLLAAFPLTASAATRTLKNCSFTPITATANKKALKIKANYTYKVTMPSKGSGFLKFTAPEDDKYFIEVSGLTSKKLYSCGFVYVMTTYGEEGERIRRASLTTQGGKAQYLNVATQADKSGAKATRYRLSRYGKLKLKKGQTVYLFFSFAKKDKLKVSIS